MLQNGVLVGAALLFGSALIERYCEARDIERYAKEESFASVDRAHVRYRLLGAQLPASPVVFLTGMTASIEQWDRVQSGVAAFAPALAYDRAGTGFSSGSSAHNAEQQADELAALLSVLGLNRPVIVVGFSSSGPIARVFAARHHELTAGLVLVEPSMPELDARLPNRQGPWRIYGRTLVTSSVVTLFGIRRLANRFSLMKFEPPARLPLDFRAQAVLLRFPHWWAVDRELMTDASSRRAVFAAPIIENQPVLMFSSTLPEDNETDRTYTQLVGEYVASHHGVLKSLGSVNHSAVLNDPGSTALIVDGIRTLTEQLRHN